MRRAVDTRGWAAPVLSDNALRVLERRYLSRDETGRPTETPKDLFARVAVNVAEADLRYDPTADVAGTAKRFYELMARLEFLPNSPTLMNAGKDLQQLSACFVLPIEDSMEGIFRTVKDAAVIHKSGGGSGFSFSRLRPRGDIVFSTHGVSSGPLSFLEVLNQTTESIKQGGTRRGANMGILRVDHPDIEEFIAAKRTMGRLENFNLSVGVTERFMEELREDSDVTLRNPRTGAAVKTMRARVIWDLIAQSAWASGEPGVIFLDRINDANPTRHVAEIESTNPCGEVPLGPYEACNLGSVSLRRFVKDRGVDWPRLRRAVHDAVHFLDNIIDASRYPVREIESQTKANRRIGLGVMGFADMLSMFGVRYDSVRGEAWARRVMKFVNDEAVRASEALANERGEFANWHGSLWHRRGARPRRNATVTTIAPTGTISMIADCSGGCEPVFALTYVKRVMEGTELVYANEVFARKAKEKGFHSERLMAEIAATGSCQGLREVPAAVQEVFRVAYDIPWEWHVRIQAAFQSHVENAVSKTINMPASATPDDVKAAYELAYGLGCKGVTVFRESSRGTAVLTTGRIRQASGTAALDARAERREARAEVEASPPPEAGGVAAPVRPEWTGNEGVGAPRTAPAWELNARHERFQTLKNIRGIRPKTSTA